MKAVKFMGGVMASASGTSSDRGFVRVFVADDLHVAVCLDNHSPVRVLTVGEAYALADEIRRIAKLAETAQLLGLEG